MTFPAASLRVPATASVACGDFPSTLPPPARPQAGTPRPSEGGYLPAANIGRPSASNADFREARSGTRADASVQTLRHDAHVHPGPGYSATQVYDFATPLYRSMRQQLAIMDEAGIDEIFYMPIPTTIEGGALACGNEDLSGIGRTYYMPDCFRDNEQPLTTEAVARLARAPQYINTAVDWEVAHAWWHLTPAERERMHPCITGFNLADAHGIHAIMRLKSAYPDTFHWMGESTGDKELVQHQNCCYKPSFGREAALHKYLAFAGRTGMGFTLHNDVSDADACIATGAPGLSENLPKLQAAFQRHAATVIVWAHMGLGKFSPPSLQHAADLRQLLQRNPNLHIDMSWDAVATHYSPHPRPAANCTPEQRAAFDPVADARERQCRIRELAAVVEAFPDRFLQGSDALVPRRPGALNTSYGIYSNLGQGTGSAGRGDDGIGLFDYLSTATLDQVLHRNFTRLYDNARAASRAYEADGMQRDMDNIQRQAVEHGRTPNNWS